METDMEPKIIGAVAFLATAWYLVEFFVFAYKFKRDNYSLWQSCGMPDSFGINGQVFYLGVVFGRKSIPSDVRISQSSRVLRLRCLFVIGLVAYLLLLAVTI